ncbi:MAG: hypothetical protein WCJ37_01790 [Syntrophus sp. (in: bacteria)]
MRTLLNTNGKPLKRETLVRLMADPRYSGPPKTREVDYIRAVEAGFAQLEAEKTTTEDKEE